MHGVRSLPNAWWSHGGVQVGLGLMRGVAYDFGVSCTIHGGGIEALRASRPSVACWVWVDRC